MTATTDETRAQPAGAGAAQPEQAPATQPRGDAFFAVERVRRATSAGEVDFPILYFDTSCLYAFFAIERSRAEAALAGSGLEPGLALGKRALVGVAFFEYRHTTIGPYNEVALAVPALPRSRGLLPAWLQLYAPIARRRLGFRIAHLPVTTEAACAAGREVWGYPKFVTGIGFRLEHGRFHGEVRDPEGEGAIFTLSGPLGVCVPAPPLSLVLYSEHGGRHLRTVVDARGTLRLRYGRGLRLRLGGSRHPMAACLRDLGLGGARPLAVMDTHRFQSRLNLGEAVSL